jgi:hypothetical protein
MDRPGGTKEIPMLLREGSYRYPDYLTAPVEPLSEHEVASYLAGKGRKVVESRGRHWVEAHSGFYEPVHVLSRRGRDEIARPVRICAGYRSALRDEDAGHANAAMPMHLQEDVAGFDLQKLTGRKWKAVRRRIRGLQREGVHLVWIDDPAVLRDQGYEHMASWHQRVGLGALPERARYLDSVTRKLASPGWLAIGAMQDGRLLGYLVDWLVERTVYGQEIHVSSENLRRHVGTYLYMASLELYARSGVIDEVANGPHRPEHEGITAYKESMGFPVVPVPARVWLPAPAKLFLKRRRPYLYYRLTGRPPKKPREGGPQ